MTRIDDLQAAYGTIILSGEHDAQFPGCPTCQIIDAIPDLLVVVRAAEKVYAGPSKGHLAVKNWRELGAALGALDREPA